MLTFTEALIHGTAKWIADHERRTLLYNHRRPHLAFGGRTPAEVYYGDRPAVLLSAGG